MGCAASGPSYKKGGVRLMSTKLTFNKDQLSNLNTYFRKILEEANPQNDSSNVTEIEATVERLVQRLMLGAGNLDGRFSSLFLVSLNEPRRIKELRFEYLLRIDELSTPALTAEKERLVSPEEDATTPGFVRLKILAAGMESWQEYTDVRGRLRRDLVKAKLANLLATTIKQDTGACDEDDNIVPAPGQVVDADVLDKILKQPDHCRVFYGPAVSDDALPERRRNHRIALIEDAGGILLRIGLDGYRTRDVEVRLLIGIGLSSWSKLADYPRRVPLHHCDALLHYTAAQTGMYAVGIGPHTGARCEDRTSLWRIRVPAAEKIMNQHYAEDTVPALTDSVLMEILYQLRDASHLTRTPRQKVERRRFAACSQDRLRVVSRHILRTVHRWSLERAGPDPLTSWAPDTLSRHVLSALDELVAALKCQSLRCYFHPRCNVMLQSARGGVAYHEDSYLSDARLVESYLAQLHHRSFSVKPTAPRPVDVMEAELIVKWRDVMASLAGGTVSADCGYSPRQLEYFTLILEEVLRARDGSLQDYADDYSYLSLTELPYHASEQVENLIYLFRLTLRQARDQIYATSARRLRGNRHGRIGRRRSHRNTIGQFDCSVGLLTDMIRRDRETAALDLDAGSAMGRTLLQWLCFAMDYERKVLEPVLRPYLANLFNGLHRNCFLAESWKGKREEYRAEMQSLGSFCRAITTGKASPANAIVDGLSSGWRWAESMVDMIERSGNSLRLLFYTPGEVVRYNLTFAGNKGLSAFSSWSKPRTVGSIARRRRANSGAGQIGTPARGKASRPGKGHTELRDGSPLTYVASIGRSGARHRGPGDLVSAMVSLAKFRILQEVAALLPKDERVPMLDMVQRAARETSRRLRKAGQPDPSNSGSPKETYTPRPDSDLSEGPERASPSDRILAEHQRQLRKEMLELRDTLNRNPWPRQRPPLWDTRSVSSWTSSVDSASGTARRRKQRAPIWNTIAGSVHSAHAGPPTRDGLAAESNNGGNKFDEMISREESPRWSTTGNRPTADDFDFRDEDGLPSWEELEATLNEKLCNYGDALPASFGPDGRSIQISSSAAE